MQEEKKTKVKYMVGTMIEIPRGALAADEIAKDAQFFSFGTNDLTQTCLGMSRDDSRHLPAAVSGTGDHQDRIRSPPIDQAGVGELMKIAVEKGRKTRPDIKLGICGEHGGEPSRSNSATLGLTYVSCSPFRVPIARLAAAQAAIEEEAARKAKKK